MIATKMLKLIIGIFLILSLKFHVKASPVPDVSLTSRLSAPKLTASSNLSEEVEGSKVVSTNPPVETEKSGNNTVEHSANFGSTEEQGVTKHPDSKAVLSTNYSMESGNQTGQNGAVNLMSATSSNEIETSNITVNSTSTNISLSPTSASINNIEVLITTSTQFSDIQQTGDAAPTTEGAPTPGVHQAKGESNDDKDDTSLDTASGNFEEHNSPVEVIVVPVPDLNDDDNEASTAEVLHISTSTQSSTGATKAMPKSPSSTHKFSHSRGRIPPSAEDSYSSNENDNNSSTPTTITPTTTTSTTTTPTTTTSTTTTPTTTTPTTTTSTATTSTTTTLTSTTTTLLAQLKDSNKVDSEGKPSTTSTTTTIAALSTTGKSLLQKIGETGNKYLKKYGPAQIAGAVIVIIMVVVLLLCVICRCRKRSRYGRLNALKLSIEDPFTFSSKYGQEKEFLLSTKGNGKYQSDRLTLLEESSEDEL